MLTIRKQYSNNSFKIKTKHTKLTQIVSKPFLIISNCSNFAPNT